MESEKVASEKDMVKLSEEIVGDFYRAFMEKHALMDTPVMEMSMNIEDEIFRKCVADWNCNPQNFWQRPQAVQYYRDMSDRIRRSIIGKDLDWKKFYDKKDSRIQFTALYSDDAMSKGNLFKRRKQNHRPVARKSRGGGRAGNNVKPSPYASFYANAATSMPPPPPLIHQTSLTSNASMLSMTSIPTSDQSGDTDGVPSVAPMDAIPISVDVDAVVGASSVNDANVVDSFSVNNNWSNWVAGHAVQCYEL